MGHAGRVAVEREHHDVVRLTRVADHRMAGHRFDALVFADHAETPEYELGQSRISKLWVQRLADRQTVFNFDRGLDVPAADPLAERIVGFLTDGLADLADAAGGMRASSR